MLSIISINHGIINSVLDPKAVFFKIYGRLAEIYSGFTASRKMM